MTRPRPRGRSGITLVEILISILIMGVGLISLATLFPLGLLRLRDASRLTRSAIMAEAARSDMEARDLFNKGSFLNSSVSPWYTFNTNTGQNFDPWVQDTPFATAVFRGYGVDGQSPNASGFTAVQNANTTVGTTVYAYPIAGPGLPVAYDPLWWAMMGSQTGNPTTTSTVTPANTVARFGKVPWLTTTTSTAGLQRLTNFATVPPVSATAAQKLVAQSLYGIVTDTFISPEDIVWQSPQDTSWVGNDRPSPVLPDTGQSANNLPTYDFHYSWMVTAQQSDARDGSVFDGDIVVFENRQFDIDPNTGNAAGETTVEGVFGYSKSNGSGVTDFYASQPSRTVVLRWRADLMTDPEVKVGSWIADTTYESLLANDAAEAKAMAAAGINGGVFQTKVFPRQRCYWYQIVKKGQAGADLLGSASYRSQTVWVHAPLKALTLMTGTANPQPKYPNAALISPNVVNVFSRKFYTR